MSALDTLVSRLNANPMYGLPVVAGGAIVAGRLIRKVLSFWEVPLVPKIADAELAVDLRLLPVPTDDKSCLLKLYQIPVRLGCAVMAPLGRDSETVLNEPVSMLLERLIPGLGRVGEQDGTVCRTWPTQLSQSGFRSTFTRVVKLADQELVGSHWSLVVGKARFPAGMLLVGLAVAAAQANRVAVVDIPHEHAWLEILKVPGV